MLQTLELKPGHMVCHNDRRYRITHLLGLNQVMAIDPETGERVSLDIASLRPDQGSNMEEKSTTSDLNLIPDEDWQIAQERFNILRPILVNPGDGSLVEKRAKEAGIHIATIYRWLNRYETTGLIISLVPDKKNGGRGNCRLSGPVEKIVRDVIQEYYLSEKKVDGPGSIYMTMGLQMPTGKKPTVTKTFKEIERICRIAKVEPPAANTVRNRILLISEEKKMRRREGNQKADEAFAPSKSAFPGADWPLAVVQIDHTKLDIVLVDDINRLPIGRPWITLAIDVFSRVVTGFYVSFDPPSAMSVGLCLVHSFLGKEGWLTKHNINTLWPVWGFPDVIHADNAREFRGEMLKRACKNNRMDLIWRPVKKPQYGAHIERLMGTFAKAIHTLPGTTFSNIKDRGDYDSEGHSAFTLSEFEAWLANHITGVYHQEVHSGIGKSPLARFEEGLLGNDQLPGRGLPERIVDEYRLRLEFMPFLERTVQKYGIQLEDIHYYHDVLRPWIKAVESGTDKRKKFLIRRDPRDISVLYFYDPELKQYFEIPYRDTSRPPISLWELKAAKRRLEEEGLKEVNEDLIFETLNRMREIENEAVRQTKKARRENQRRRHNQEGVQIHREAKVNALQPKTAGRSNEPTEDFTVEDIKPFEELEEL